MVGEKLKIEVGGEVYEKETDENGFASLDLKLKQDTYEVVTTFEGNDRYDPVEATSQIEVKTRNVDRDVMIEVEDTGIIQQQDSPILDGLKNGDNR